MTELRNDVSVLGMLELEGLKISKIVVEMSCSFSVRLPAVGSLPNFPSMFTVATTPFDVEVPIRIEVKITTRKKGIRTSSLTLATVSMGFQVVCCNVPIESSVSEAAVLGS